MATARTQRVKGVYSTYDLTEEDDEPERLYISFTAVEVQSKTEPATAPKQKNGTWAFGLLKAARPRPFGEREKPANSLDGQEEPDLSYTYGETDSEVLDSGASSHYLDDLIIPSLKYRLLKYVLLTTPRKILTAGGALLDGTAEGILQGLVTDDHAEQHLARIDILIVPGIGRNLLSFKSATKKGVVSIFAFDNPRLELSGITIPLRAEDDDLYSLVFGSSADSHGDKELVMNAMINAQLWHRQLGHLNKRSLELMQGHDGNGVAFDGSSDHCDVFAVGKSHQLAHPKKAKHADITVPFQLVYGDLMGSFKPAARGGYEYVSKITDQFTKWTAVYLLCAKDQAFASLQLFVTSTVILFGRRIVTVRADKGGEYIGEDFKAYCQETGITQQIADTNTP